MTTARILASTKKLLAAIRSGATGPVICHARLGGLHHRYEPRGLRSADIHWRTPRGTSVGSSVINKEQLAPTQHPCPPDSTHLGWGNSLQDHLRGAVLILASYRFQARFEALQSQKQIVDRAQTLGNFALASAAANDWPQAISQLQEGIRVCGGCTSLGQLHKDLGLIYLHSGDAKDGLRELLEAKKLTPADPDIDKAIRIAQTTRR